MDHVFQLEARTRLCWPYDMFWRFWLWVDFCCLLAPTWQQRVRDIGIVWKKIINAHTKREAVVLAHLFVSFSLHSLSSRYSFLLYIRILVLRCSGEVDYPPPPTSAKKIIFIFFVGGGLPAQTENPNSAHIFLLHICRLPKVVCVLCTQWGAHFRFPPSDPGDFVVNLPPPRAFLWGRVHHYFLLLARMPKSCPILLHLDGQP